MVSFTYVDPEGSSHNIPGIRLGSLDGIDGSVGTVQTISNSDYTAVIKTRISAAERVISLTIPVEAGSAAELETNANTILSWFYQSETPGKLICNRDDNTSREVEVYVQQGYPTRSYESNTFCWIMIQLVACSPYWTDTAETAITHNTAFTNDGDYPAECRLTLNVTVKQITLDGDVIMKFRDSSTMQSHYVTITDNAITATDTSGNNALYKFTLSSKFDLIPTGTHTISGCKGTFRKRWGHA